VRRKTGEEEDWGGRESKTIVGGGEHMQTAITSVGW
jgi:hypothetical protein